MGSPTNSRGPQPAACRSPWVKFVKKCGLYKTCERSRLAKLADLKQNVLINESQKLTVHTWLTMCQCHKHSLSLSLSLSLTHSLTSPTSLFGGDLSLSLSRFWHSIFCCLSLIFDTLSSLYLFISIYLSIHLYLYFSIHLYLFFLSISISIFLSIYISIFLSIYISIYLIFYPSIYNSWSRKS